MGMANSIGELHDKGDSKARANAVVVSFALVTVLLIALVSLATGVYATVRYFEKQDWFWIPWAALNLAAGVGLALRLRWARQVAILLYTVNIAVVLFLLMKGPGWLFLVITFWMACLLALLDSQDAFPAKRDS